MNEQKLDQTKARQKAVAQEGQSTKFMEFENCANVYSQDIYQNISLHDSTSEWEKQKEALKKINNSINKKDQKDKKNDKNQNSTPSAE